MAHGYLALSLIDGMKNQAAAQMKGRASMGWGWTFGAPVIAGDQNSAVPAIGGRDATRSEGRAILHLKLSATNQNGRTVQDGQSRLLAYR